MRRTLLVSADVIHLAVSSLLLRLPRARQLPQVLRHLVPMESEAPANLIERGWPALKHVQYLKLICMDLGRGIATVFRDHFRGRIEEPSQGAHLVRGYRVGVPLARVRTAVLSWTLSGSTAFFRHIGLCRLSPDFRIVE